MKFIISKENSKRLQNSILLGELVLQYESTHGIIEKTILIDTESHLFFGDTNFSFAQTFKAAPAPENIVRNINQLSNGYIFCYSKDTRQFELYTDIFGFYHVYYVKAQDTIAISTDFRELLAFSQKVPDNFALLDIALFNYTLLDRTIITDIKRLGGGVKYTLSKENSEIQELFNFAANFSLPKRAKRISKKDFAITLANELENQTIESLPIYLTMSGGFDSRALLAASNFLNHSVNAFTFGQINNIEAETIKPFINEFVNTYTFLELDDKYINNIESLFDQFISKNLDNPVFHSLIEYELSYNKIPSSNLLVGFMGGELIIGQSLGAQVTFSKFATTLLSSNNIEEIKDSFFQEINQNILFNISEIKTIASEYLKTLEVYLKQPGNINILKFMLNEEYAHFFGAANTTFRNKYNLITPFVSVRFLELILNSQICLLRKNQFKKNPIANFKAKILYAKSIEYLNPELASTKFDRLYMLKDISRLYRLPVSVATYLNNRVNKKARKVYNSTTRYDLWYKNLVLSYLNYNQAATRIFKQKNKLEEKEFNNLPILQKRRMLRLMASIFVLEKIKNM